VVPIRYLTLYTLSAGAPGGLCPAPRDTITRAAAASITHSRDPIVMSDSCLFCRIAQGQIPAHVVHEDEHTLAFLDIHPVRPGHVLIIPKQHYPYFEDIPPPQASHILALGQSLSRAMK